LKKEKRRYLATPIFTQITYGGDAKDAKYCNTPVQLGGFAGVVVVERGGLFHGGW
jgi:hypothetical protein